MGEDAENPTGKSLNNEFFKKSSDIRLMIDHMKKRAELIRDIYDETAIPEQARDMAIKALSNELSENALIFFDYLINFINLGKQGLHRVDIKIGFTLLGPGILEMDCCHLLIDDEIMEIPMEIGARYLHTIFYSAEKQHPDFILQYYKEEETHYDQILGGLSGRCSLQIMDELFPKRGIHITMRLPAQTLIEHHIQL